MKQAFLSLISVEQPQDEDQDEELVDEDDINQVGQMGSVV